MNVCVDAYDAESVSLQSNVYAHTHESNCMYTSVQSRSPDWPGCAIVTGRRRRAPPMIMNTNIHERVEYHLDTTVYTNINIYVYIHMCKYTYQCRCVLFVGGDSP